MLKYIKLNDLSVADCDNILLVIDEKEFKLLSKDIIVEIFNYKLLKKIYWIFILVSENFYVEDEIDFLIEKVSKDCNDENILNIITTSYKIDDIEEFLSDFNSCLKTKNNYFNCFISKELTNLIKSDALIFGTNESKG